MKVLLILYISSTGPGNVLMERFPSVAACERAVETLRELRTSSRLWGSAPSGSYKCLEEPE